MTENDGAEIASAGNKKVALKFGFVVVMSLISVLASAGLKDWLGDILGNKNTEQSSTSSFSTLTDGEISSGLRLALKKGIYRAVDTLGSANGFYHSSRFRISVPKKLNKVAKTLRKVGLSKVVRRFELTLNRAAESAVNKIIPIFTQAISDMSIEDAVSILRGSSTAATDYFRERTSVQLVDEMLPVVQKATARAGVTVAYKKMVSKLVFMRQFVNQDDLELDRYITNLAIRGIFTLIAEEEQAIRSNPVKRSSRLLRKVFRSLHE